MKKKEKNHNEELLKQEKKMEKEDGGESLQEIKLTPQEYENMVKEIEDLKNKWLRTAAELENAKKRWQKEKEEILLFGNSQLISALLPVLDHFDHAMEQISPEKNEFEQGVELIYKELSNILSKFGLEKISDLRGKDFDPFEQEAITYEENDDIPEGKVIEVVRAGYKLQDRLLRPALVKVSKGVRKESDSKQGGDKNGQSDRN